MQNSTNNTRKRRNIRRRRWFTRTTLPTWQKVTKACRADYKNPEGTRQSFCQIGRIGNDFGWPGIKINYLVYLQRRECIVLLLFGLKWCNNYAWYRLKNVITSWRFAKSLNYCVYWARETLHYNETSMMTQNICLQKLETTQLRKNVHNNAKIRMCKSNTTQNYRSQVGKVTNSRQVVL